ncbi:MAG: hypothetical protein ACK55I_45170, partial [bacterium]
MLPRDREQVSVGQDLEVVVQRALGVGQHVLPHLIAVPVVLRDAPAEATAEEGRVGVDARGEQHVAVVLQVGR